MTPDTFGATELQNNNANTLLRAIALAVDEQITEPVVQGFYEWLLLDPSVPDDEKGDFQIIARGSTAMVEKAIQEQFNIELLKASVNPAYRLDPKKCMEQTLKAKRLDPRNYQYTEAEIAKMEEAPPQPPVQLAVQQLKNQGALQVQQAEAQTEAQQAAAEMQQEQQRLANGQATPHMAAASARVEQERIRAKTSQVVEASRASAEMARAEKEQQIAQQNGEYRLKELETQREIALLEYANKEKLSVDAARVALAKSAMDNRTKRELAAAEIQMAQNENAQDRALDLHKHHTSLVRDEMSTPVTP
jgi:hypothetical protein